MFSSETNPTDLGHTIKDWLVAEGLKASNQADPNAIFKLLINHPAEVPVQIWQEIGWKDKIMIMSTINFDTPALQKFETLPEDLRNDVLWQIRFLLIAHGVTFKFQPPKASWPQQIQVSKILYYDGVTKDRFMEWVLKAVEAVLLISWTVTRGLRFDKQKGPPTYTT